MHFIALSHSMRSVSAENASDHTVSMCRYHNSNSADESHFQRGLQVSGSRHEPHGPAARHQLSSGEGAQLPQAARQDDQHNRGDCPGMQAAPQAVVYVRPHHACSLLAAAKWLLLILLRCARLLLSASTAIVPRARLLAARPKRDRGLFWTLAHMVSMPVTEQGSFPKLQFILQVGTISADGEKKTRRAHSVRHGARGQGGRRHSDGGQDYGE